MKFYFEKNGIISPFQVFIQSNQEWVTKSGLKPIKPIPIIYSRKHSYVEQTRIGSSPLIKNKTAAVNVQQWGAVIKHWFSLPAVARYHPLFMEASEEGHLMLVGFVDLRRRAAEVDTNEKAGEEEEEEEEEKEKKEEV
ncbi:hypothetical protein Q9L58_009066 [Maublancomyces gigas]|uniref:Uncharacterized protein n=1 Tax=Discina gigas TaxID=1032678 RepID=A0ABR3G861_9PEZI